jgi:probable phosphoglycerate mutase
MMLYVVRHGETVWNVDHRVQGQTDVPLTEKGKEEASELKELVSGLDIDVVISSPLIRAKETAKIIIDNKLPVNTDDRIIERDWGLNEGEIVDNVDMIDCWDFSLNTKGLEFEKVQDFMSRVSEFLEDIKVRYQDKNVLVVAHSAVLRAIHYLLSGIPEDGDLTRIDIPNLRIIEYKI